MTAGKRQRPVKDDPASVYIQVDHVVLSVDGLRLSRADVTELLQSATESAKAIRARDDKAPLGFAAQAELDPER